MRAGVLALALLACAPTTHGPGHDGDDTGTTTGDEDKGPVAADCEGAELDGEPTLATTAAGTVPRLDVATAAAVRTRVVFDNGDGLERTTTWSEAGQAHAHLLVGIVPSAAFAWRVEVEGSDAACSASGVGQNGELPAGMPELNATFVDDAAVQPGLVVAPLFTGNSTLTYWVSLVDEAGRYVFGYNTTDGDLEVPVFRAIPAADGDGLLALTQAHDADADGLVRRVRLDGTEGEAVSIQGMHTDFVEMSGGRLATLTWEVRTVGDDRVLGDQVVVREADGTVRVVWNAFDQVPYDPDGDWQPGFYLSDANVLDWTHANGIAWDAASDDLFITLTAYDAVARIDTATATQEWIVGTDYGDFELAEGHGQATDWPHSVQPLGDDRVLVFNRGDFHDDPEVCSWASILQLDADEGVVRTEASWESQDCLLVSFLGQARQLDNGNVEVDWSSSGRLDEYTAEGELVRQLDLSLGAGFGFTERM